MKASGLGRTVMPPSFGGYRIGWLRGDILAGITLAAVAIPECMGYSGIAGVPVVVGIYTIILPTLVFAMIGSSRLMVVGADSATAALLASGIGGLGIAGLAPGSTQWLQWASLIAVVTGVLLGLAWLLRLGFLGDFLSTAVLVGFLAGTGVTVMSGQIPSMLGIDAGTGRIWERWATVIEELPDIHWAAAVVALISLGLLIVGQLWLPRVPVAVVVVIGSIVLVGVFGWQDAVPVVGPLATGFPGLAVPNPGLGVDELLKAGTVAVGCVLVILAQSAATARSFAQRHGQTANVNRDILGLGAANLAAGFGGTFVVNGSPTKTQLLDEQRGRTQVANITMAAIALLVVLFLGDALANLPHAVLGAIVFLVAARLIDVAKFRRIWRVRRSEFVIAVVAAVVVIVLGVQVGVITAMGVSLLEIIRRQYRPERFVIGVNDRGTRTFLPATPGLQSAPGLIVFRYDADLFYANASRFSDDVMALIRSAPQPVRWLVLDCSAISDVDYSASTVLADLISYVHSHRAHFVLAGVDPELSETLLTDGVLGGLNPDHVFGSVGEAVRAYRAWEQKADGTVEA